MHPHKSLSTESLFQQSASSRDIKKMNLLDENEQEIADSDSHDSKELCDQSNKNESWSDRRNFFFCVLSCSMGYRSVLKFPFLCQQNGGGVFFIPYVLTNVCVGLPMMVVDFTNGQFTSGVIGYWMFCPLFRGIQLLSFLVNLYITMYYIATIAWWLLYLTACFQKNLPWEECRAPWATPYCQDNANVTSCTGKFKLFENGTCYDAQNGKLLGIYNFSLAQKHGIKMSFPAEDYMKYESLKFGESSGIHDIGPLQWNMCLCLAVTWIFLFACLTKGIKIIEKICYVTITFPMLIIVVTTAQTFALKGSGDGVKFFLNLDISYLWHVDTWKEAILCTISNLNILQNVLPGLAAYNKFQYNYVRDAFIIILIDVLISFLCGVAVFSCIGVFASRANVPLDDLMISSITFSFAVLPQAFTVLPLARTWSIIFFVMLINLGTTTEMIYVKCLTKDIIYFFNVPTKYKLPLCAGMCFALYICGLSMATPGGLYVFTLLEERPFFNSIAAILFAVAAIATFGIKRYFENITCMVGANPVPLIPWKYLQWYLTASWCVLCPLFTVYLLLDTLFDMHATAIVTYKFPLWAKALVWTYELVSAVTPCFVILWDVYKTREDGVKQAVVKLTQPHPLFTSFKPFASQSQEAKLLSDKALTLSFGSHHSDTAAPRPSLGMAAEKTAPDMSPSLSSLHSYDTDDVARMKARKRANRSEAKDMKFTLRHLSSNSEATSFRTRSKRKRAHIRSATLRRRRRTSASADKYETLRSAGKRGRRARRKAEEEKALREATSANKKERFYSSSSSAEKTP